MPSPENPHPVTTPAVVQRIPASFVAIVIVMGLGGHGHAWRGAGRRFPELALFGEALVLFVAVLWVRLTSSYIALSTVTAPAHGTFLPPR